MKSASHSLAQCVDNFDSPWTGAGSILIFLMLGKQLISFGRSNNSITVDVKIGGSALDKILFFKILGLSYSSIAFIDKIISLDVLDTPYLIVEM